MKIVNRARGSREWKSFARLDEARSRANDISPPLVFAFPRASVHARVAFLHLFSTPFFCKSVKRAQFRHGIFIGVDSSALCTYPSARIPCSHIARRIFHSNFAEFHSPYASRIVLSFTRNGKQIFDENVASCCV